MNPYLWISTNDSNGEIIVTRVSKDGPSDKSGIRKNDIIKSVNGKQVNNIENFYRTIWNSGKIGVKIQLGIIRDKKKLNFKVKSVDRMDYFIKNKSY